MKNSFFMPVLLFFAVFSSFAQSNFSRGEELFLQNKPGEALVFFESAIAEDPAFAKAFLYLGVAYEQLGRDDEAVAAYRKILGKPGSHAANAAVNLANVYFRKGNFQSAEEFYTRAIAEDAGYSQAYLGRANTRIKTGSVAQAAGDYLLYLEYEPASPQRGSIERLVALIREETAAEERRKLLAEEAARAEAERKQRLLDEVAASLQQAADASQGLSSGAEKAEGYDDEFELE